jgi:branched-chain amino acid transport system permease protein
MTFWLVQTLNGISFGMLLFLLAAGLSLIYGLMKVLNLAHGSFYLLGGYIGLAAIHLTGSFVLAALAGSLTIAVIGGLMERFFLRRLYLQELPQALLTFGFLFIFSDLATVIWGRNPETIPKPSMFRESLQLGAFYYPSYRLFIIAFGLVALGSCGGFRKERASGQCCAPASTTRRWPALSASMYRCCSRWYLRWELFSRLSAV